MGAAFGSAAGAKFGDLHPGGEFSRGKRAGQIKLLGFFAAEFAAGSLGNAARRDKFDAIGWKTEAAGDLFRDGGGDFGTGCSFGTTYFGDYDQFFGATRFIFQTESDNSTFTDAIDARGKFFDFMRVKIAAALDDDVFHASGDVELAFGAISAVSGIDPRIFALACGRTLRQ